LSIVCSLLCPPFDALAFPPVALEDVLCV